MDFIDAIRVLLRQWRIVVIGAIVVGALGGAAIFLVPTKYQATGQLVLLLPPQSTGTSTPTNPYLNLEPGLTITASLIAATMSTKDAARNLELAGFTSDYAIGLIPGSGPVLDISADDTDGPMAVRTRDEVIRRLQEELVRIQLAENAPPRQLIHARTNSVPNVAESLPGSKIRALAVIGGVGVVGTLLAAFVRDRRNFVRLPQSAAVHASSAPPPPDPAPPEHNGSALLHPPVALPPVAAPAPQSTRGPVAKPTTRQRKTNRKQRDPISVAQQSSWWDT